MLFNNKKILFLVLYVLFLIRNKNKNDLDGHTQEVVSSIPDPFYSTLYLSMFYQLLLTNVVTNHGSARDRIVSTFAEASKRKSIILRRPAIRNL